MTNDSLNMLAVLVIFGWMFVFVAAWVLYGLMWLVMIIYQIYHTLRYGRQA